MKLLFPLTFLFIACCFSVSLWIMDARDPFPLPHRPTTGNHGQGAMIDARHCPWGSYAYYIDELFLTCMRGTAQ